MLPSFCRVTGNSRGLPKPNYFPLLPAISPVDARNICKQRGKTQLDDRQYVPVIEFARPPKTVQCHITQNSTGNESHRYDPLTARRGSASADQVEACRITAKHQVNTEYRYVLPILPTGKHADKEVESLKCVLRKVSQLAGNLPEEQRFVYALDDERQCLVLPADMEEAVRRGEIESLLVSKDGSKTMCRLKNGPTISLATKEVEAQDEADLLYQGNGQSTQVLVKQRKIREYKKRKSSDLAKKNDEKKLKAESVEPESEDDDESEQTLLQVDWEDRMTKLGSSYRAAINLLMMGTDWRDLIFPKISSWVWEDFPSIEEPSDAQLVHDMTVHDLTPIQVAIESLSPGFLQTKGSMSNDSVGFETVPTFERIRPFNVQPPKELNQAVDALKPTQSMPVKELFKSVETIMFLPFITEVEKVADALPT